VARKPARQGSKAANKGAYSDVSDRHLQLQLTTKAKILTSLELFFRIFAFVGFIDNLTRFLLKAGFFIPSFPLSVLLCIFSSEKSKIKLEIRLNLSSNLNKSRLLPRKVAYVSFIVYNKCTNVKLGWFDVNVSSYSDCR